MVPVSRPTSVASQGSEAVGCVEDDGVDVAAAATVHESLHPNLSRSKQGMRCLCCCPAHRRRLPRHSPPTAVAAADRIARATTVAVYDLVRGLFPNPISPHGSVCALPFADRTRVVAAAAAAALDVSATVLCWSEDPRNMPPPRPATPICVFLLVRQRQLNHSVLETGTERELITRNAWPTLRPLSPSLSLSLSHFLSVLSTFVFLKFSRFATFY